MGGLDLAVLGQGLPQGQMDRAVILQNFLFSHMYLFKAVGWSCEK